MHSETGGGDDDDDDELKGESGHLELAVLLPQFLATPLTARCVFAVVQLSNRQLT